MTIEVVVRSGETPETAEEQAEIETIRVFEGTLYPKIEKVEIRVFEKILGRKIEQGDQVIILEIERALLKEDDYTLK